MSEQHGPYEVTDATFASEVLEANLPVVVDFGADWCPPCRVIEPMMHELAAEYAGKLRIVQVNTDENPHYAGMLGIQGLPTLVIFHQGQEINRLIGARPKSSYKQNFDALVAHTASVIA